HDALRGLRQLLLPGDLLAVVAQAPDAAGVEVAVDVGAGQVGQALAVVNVAAGQAAEVRVRVLGDRRQDRRRPLGAFRAEGVCALVDAPAVVAALLDLQDALPQVLADLADPQLARGPVEAHLPRLPHAVGPDFRAGALHAHERVVLGDAVGLALVGVIDVD